MEKVASTSGGIGRGAVFAVVALFGFAAFESNFAVKVGFVRALLEKHGISCDRADARPLPENRPDAVEEAARAVILFHAAESMKEDKSA